MPRTWREKGEEKQGKRNYSIHYRIVSWQISLVGKESHQHKICLEKRLIKNPCKFPRLFHSIEGEENSETAENSEDDSSVRKIYDGKYPETLGNRRMGNFESLHLICFRAINVMK